MTPRTMLLVSVALAGCGRCGLSGDSDRPGDTSDTSDTGIRLGRDDLAVLTSLAGEQGYLFSGMDVNHGCRIVWESHGVLSEQPCSDCDLVFDVSFVLLQQQGDCDGLYGHPVPEDYEGVLGVALDYEGEGPVVGPVAHGRLWWGGGSIMGPATASADYRVVRPEPLVMDWDYSWQDPHGYYYQHGYHGSARLE